MKINKNNDVKIGNVVLETDGIAEVLVKNLRKLVRYL